MNKHDSVKHYILDNIASGFYQANQMIASEHSLSDALGISRTTIRKALDDLVSQKVLYKQQGRGTFVTANPQFDDFKCGIGFSKEALARKQVASSEAISLTKETASLTTSQDLNIDLNAPVWHIQRTRLADGIAIAYEDTYVDALLVPNLSVAVCESSLYQHLESLGIRFAYADQRIEAVNADAFIASKLNVSLNQAIIRMYVIAYMENGTPFNCGTSYYQTLSFALKQSVY